MSSTIERLHEAVTRISRNVADTSRTAKLVQGGRTKMAKKLVEEASEVSLDAVTNDREAVVRESADLIYNLTVLWVDMGISPDDVWNEMKRREQLYGIAEKLHKGPVAVINGGVTVGPQGDKG
ncbi:MAG: phosphoribosyl-ATP diphosphatase [Phreatobacter sp.]|uniref:phosphoribosyl-ATP diphosphatase n=1 Tax=Phreatobacter sp. TaxID=1966341 RepID=UPI001A53F807|nr:phosphoribosyl-ATP diphosphatase [Phreatobacter sp.]MBL8571217.1 phosphoribosyl-ATP diphosphatase [Phreatobacter sp.]